MRVVEVQGRGALHDHLLVWSPVPLDGKWLREVAMDSGFGHASAGPVRPGKRGGLELLAPGSRAAARYVGKYVTKATDARDDVPWTVETVDRATGLVLRRDVPGRYRCWASSRKWGDSMAVVRARARVVALRLVVEREGREEEAAWFVAWEPVPGLFDDPPDYLP
jgi:hypothetical protein